MASEVLIGAGGWQYFIVPEADRLKAYSRVFDFVEVNSSFYRLVPLKQAAYWRSRVPDEFVFTVKCHRAVTHIHRLRPSEPAVQAFEHCVKICRVLRAPIIVLETPATLSVDGRLLRSFFSTVKLDGIKAGLELRGWAGRDVFEAMNDLGIVHVTDFSKEMPRVHDGEIAYSRLFGRGVHNIYMFDDDELVEISGKADGVGSEKVLLSFHGLRMYVDATRLKVFRKTGKMPSVTGKAGAESFREVMADAVFPAAKEELLTKHGWKLFDIEAGRRARVADLLRKIPDRTYVNVDDLWADVVQVV